jgi:hypothetical protein
VSEASALIDIVARIIELRHDANRISPSWVATEALLHLDPSKEIQKQHPLIYLGCHLELRQIARSLCRNLYEHAADPQNGPQHELFPDLQWRYPTARSKTWEEPEYVRLELLAQEDIDYNVARLRREGRAKLKHADALEAWGRSRRRTA